MSDKFFTTLNPEIRFLSLLFFCLSIFVFSSYIIGSRIHKRVALEPEVRTPATFPTVTLLAKAAYVYDARTEEVLYASNANTRLPLASLTKVMSALVAVENNPTYSTVTVGKEALKQDGDSGLRVGEKWSLKNLLDFALITSSNDGIRAVALALGAVEKAGATSDEAVQSFVGMMNKKAAELNLKNTYFWNESGLDESEVKGGAYGTAHDVVELMNYVQTHYPELLEATQQSETTIASDSYKHVAKNTNTLANEIPGIRASKTGFTSTAGGNLTFIFDPEIGRPIIVAILGSTEKGRFEDARTLIDATMEYIKEQ